MKNIYTTSISILLLFSLLTLSCTQNKTENTEVNNVDTQNPVQINSDSSNSKINNEIDSIITIQKNDSLTFDTILPTPDTQFFSSLDTSRIVDAEYVIDQYLNTYFHIVEAEKVIRRTDINNPEYPEGPTDCGFRTVYNNNIVLEDDFGCESYDRTTSIKFGNYSFKEVDRVIKILLPKVFISDEYGHAEDRDGWFHLGIEDEYYEYGGHCNLEIDKRENKMLVEYGCGC